MSVRARFQYKCKTCEKIHEGFPAIAFDTPLHYLAVPESERSRRCKIDEDLCVVDNEAFYVRCTLEYPVLDSDEVFNWGIWGSLSKENFDHYLRDRSNAGNGFFSYLANSFPNYPETLNLHCDMLVQASGIRPKLVLHGCDHPLYNEQQQGIPFAKALEIAKPFIRWHSASL